MTESLLGRMRRVVGHGVETAVEAAERASGTGLMREAIREVDRAADRLHGAKDALAARGRDRAERRRAIGEEIARLNDHARFALAKDRRDLAEAAVARQVDLEAERDRLAEADDDDAGADRALDAKIAELAARRATMAADLAAHQGARSAMPALGAADRAAGHARDAFDRARAASAGPPVDVAAEVAAIRRSETIAARLAVLSPAPAAALGKKAARRRAGH